MTVASAKSIEAAQNLLASVETALLMIAANFFPEPEQRRLSIRGRSSSCPHAPFR